MKKVSIIVPVYNVEKYLDKCLESIINQTYTNLEILLIDDGSPDNCPKICDEWQKKDKRIKVIHKTNGGLSDSRNCGLDNVTGEYISFIDSDDIIYHKMIENMVKYLEEKNADIVSCEFSRFSENSFPKFIITNKLNIYTRDESLIKLINENISNHVCNKIFKKKLWDNVRFPTGRYYEDIMVTYKIFLKIKKIVMIQDQYYGYMYRKESITAKCSNKSIEDFINSINTRYNDLISNKKLKEKLIISRLKCIYLVFLKTAINGDKNFFNSTLISDEYTFLKENINMKRIFKYIEHDDMKTKILKITLLIDKNIFFKYKKKRV